MKTTWGRYGQFSLELAKRKFLAKTLTIPNGCVVWTGCKNKHGYGQTSVGGKWMLTHRAAMLLLGGIDPEGQHVLHHCDNTSCVRLDHLYLGTQRENVHDCERRKRAKHPKGEKHGRAKLTEADVRRILNRHFLKKESIRSLARKYPVNRTVIRLIVRGLLWEHITTPYLEAQTSLQSRSDLPCT